MKKLKFLLNLSFLLISFLFITSSANAASYPELCSVLNRTIGFGEVGIDVRRLQVVLGQEGISYINSTGYFGPVTQGAVRIFQQRNGIRQTGAVGPITLARMRATWCQAEGNFGGGTNYNTSVYGPVEVSIAPISSTNLSVTIGWNSKNAASCRINNEQVEPNGQRTYTLTGETNFTVACTGYSFQPVSKTITVRPNQDISRLPTMNVYINPTQALVNTYATLYWNSNNTSYCSVNGQSVNPTWSQQILVTGSAVVDIDIPFVP